MYCIFWPLIHKFVNFYDKQYSWGNCPLVNCPWVDCPWVNCPWVNCPWVNFPWANCPITFPSIFSRASLPFFCLDVIEQQHSWQVSDIYIYIYYVCIRKLLNIIIRSGECALVSMIGYLVQHFKTGIVTYWFCSKYSKWIIRRPI